MKRAIALSILLAGISATGIPRAEVPDVYSGGVNPLAGKSGDGLLSAIRREARPSRLVSQNEVTYTFFDPFEGTDVPVVRGGMPAGYSAGQFVPPLWWDSKAYADTLSRDLNNFIPLTSEPKKALADRRPGVLSEVTTAFAHWSIGRAKVYGEDTDLYSPPVSMRGRIARAYFYAAACYHCDYMKAEGYMMMNTEYPYLTRYAMDLLCAWAREQAPDAAEIAWEEYVSSVQGGGNPFVTEPALAEYVWGDRSGEVYAVEGEPVPLHSVYSMDDDRIYLLSPHVPQDAVWSIDGVPAMADSYNPRDLGLGEHHLTYTSASSGCSGRLMIKIVSK